MKWPSQRDGAKGRGRTIFKLPVRCQNSADYCKVVPSGTRSFDVLLNPFVLFEFILKYVFKKVLLHTCLPQLLTYVLKISCVLCNDT